MLIGRLIFNEFVKIQKENFIDIKQVMQQLKRQIGVEKKQPLVRVWYYI